MQEEKEQNHISQRRRTRINRIKKGIRWMLIIGIIFPSILSVFLLIKVSNLSQSVDKLEEQWSVYTNIKSLNLEPPIAEINEEPIPNHASSDILENVETQIYEANQDKQVEDILPASTRKVYLTFDDGPSANTDDILDVLAAYDVKATFFVVGKEEEQFKQDYQRIVEEGHTIGLHSYSHKYEEIYASTDDFLEDFWKESNFIYEITGVRSFCYRFPGGSSTTKMELKFEKYRECLELNDIQYYDWNISSQDASAIPLTKEQIISNVTSDLSKYETAIILFHDAYGKQSTVDALPEIIEYIQSMENTVLLPISIGTEQIHQK